jgi:DNA-binding NtrC family response regulator
MRLLGAGIAARGAVRAAALRLASPPILERMANAAPRRILVVDDNSGVASFLADLFAWAGYEVDVALDAWTALDRIAGALPGVIVSDFRMPGLDGAGFYDELARRCPELCSRFILVVGDVHAEAVRAFVARTRVPCLDKPIDLDAAVRLIQDLIGPPRP